MSNAYPRILFSLFDSRRTEARPRTPGPEQKLSVANSGGKCYCTDTNTSKEGRSRKGAENMEKYVIVGLGMIGSSLAVLTTRHGMKTVCYVRNAAKIPVYRAGFKQL